MEVLQQRYSRLHARTEEVLSLAAGDDFFANEARQLQLQRKVLRAEVDVAENVKEQRILEAELLQAIKSDSPNVNRLLAKLFRTISSDDATTSLTEAQAELAMRQLKGVQQLRRDGYASWMELTTAEVRYEEAVDRVAATLHRHDRLKAIASVLETIAEETPVVAAAE